MRNTYLQSLIKKISKKRGKLIYSDELKTLSRALMGKQYSNAKAYKLIYYLKNKWYLISLKKNIFYVKLPEDFLSEEAIIEDRYRPILYNHCKSSLWTKRYIGGEKALEMHYSNFEIPEIVLVVNQEKQSKEMALAMQSIQFKKYTAKGKNLFNKFKKHTSKIKIGRYNFPIASKELSLLECMYNHDEMFHKDTDIMVKKVIKRSTQFDIDIIAQLVKLGKHHTSINRLYKIAKKTNKTFAKQLSEIIKRYSFFLDI